MTFLRHRSNRPHWHAPAVAAALLLLIGAGCSKADGPGRGGPAGRGGAGAAPVIVDQARIQVVPLVIDGVGTVESIRSADVRAQITGTLWKIAIEEGQDVKQGDLLFEIDPRPFENALRSALADQKRVAVQLENAKAQVGRYRALSVGTMVSEEQVQQIEANARALEAQAAASEAAVATARLQLSYCSIRAPIAGRTGNINVHEGDLIRGNDTAPLVSINQLDPIYVTFGIAQQHLAAISRYRAERPLKVDAGLSATDAPVSQGELTFVDNTVDPSTGTIKLKATFPNRDRLLWPGQFATVTMLLASPEVLTVPVSAVQSDQAGQHVFVVKPDNTAEFRAVTIERTHGEVAVVSKGVSAGETIIVDGQLRVVAGGPVQIKAADVLTNPESAPTDVAGDGAARSPAKGRNKKQGS